MLRPRYPAPSGLVPKLGETWLPVGRRALVGSVFLPRTDAVRGLVPPDLALVPVLPGRTLGVMFLGDYGPGSTLEYSELGILPALVSAGGSVGFFVSHMWVDNPLSLAGGRHAGVPKELATFDWEEEGRRGLCTVSTSAGSLVRVRYRQGPLPLPTVPIPSISVREDLVFHGLNGMVGDLRLGRVAWEPTGLEDVLQRLGGPVASVVASPGWRGWMLDRLRVVAFLPDRTIERPAPG